MVGTVLDGPVTYFYYDALNGAVLCKVTLHELTLFYNQLGLDTSPQIWVYIQGSKLLNGCFPHKKVSEILL